MKIKVIGRSSRLPDENDPFSAMDECQDYFHTNNIIHVYGTRSYDMLHLYTVNLSFGAKCIKFKGCLLWNSLPRSITNINSHVVFKKKLKGGV